MHLQLFQQYIYTKVENTVKNVPPGYNYIKNCMNEQKWLKKK